jgi:hypothetical protein
MTHTAHYEVNLERSNVRILPTGHVRILPTKIMSSNSVIIVKNATNLVIVFKNVSGRVGELQLEMQNSKNCKSRITYVCIVAIWVASWNLKSFKLCPKIMITNIFP